MIDAKVFGDREHPLRSSNLPALMRCSWRAFLVASNLEDESGRAADTGSAVHAGAAAMHKGASVDEALAVLRRSTLEQFLKADLTDAEEVFSHYARDPRNQDKGIFYAVEEKIELEIPADKSDPTGAPIIIRGTLDQIREVNGRLSVWDIKCSTYPGWDILQEYAFQLAAYTVGACERWKIEVHPGGFILPRRYVGKFRIENGKRVPVPKPETKPAGVFYESEFDLRTARLMLRMIAKRVAQVRKGEALPSPGSYCRYCPASSFGMCSSVYEAASKKGVVSLL
jgi:hypothetical protein